MKKTRENNDSGTCRIAAGLALLTTFTFFQFAYPYHLARLEQQTLFVFDRDYIRQTYRGTGWLGNFAGDFLEQFFHLPVVAPLIMALLLTAIGAVVYRIVRKFLGRWPSLAIAAVFFLWSFMRETGNLFITRYTVVTLGYLSLVLLALQFRKAWARVAGAVLLLAIGAWALGAPYHKYYGKLWGSPKFKYERVIGLDIETARENWDRVLKLSEKDLYMVEASYCYDLAHAMKGDLGDCLLGHSQGGPNGLLLQVSTDYTEFTNCLAGEAWFHLGDMTVAEQSAIIALQGSPKHTGTRFLVRLARINLISGEDAAAMKYLNLLARTLFYGKWARSMMPANQDEATRARIAEARSNLIREDLVHHSNVPRTILLSLLDVNPGNTLARNYLLCFDLMCYDMPRFIEDYTPEMIDARLYKEAVLVWLGQSNSISVGNAAEYGVDAATVNRLDRFYRNPELYRDTYWYYYADALYRSNQ